MVYLDGRKYSGEWYKNVWDGQGTLTLSNGDTYSGEFYKGLR